MRLPRPLSVSAYLRTYATHALKEALKTLARRNAAMEAEEVAGTQQLLQHAPRSSV